MNIRRHTFYFILAIALGLNLTACLHFGSVSDGCVAGFVRTENGCRSVSALTNAELESANSRLSSMQAQNESQDSVNAMRETQKLIARVQASRRSTQDTFEKNTMVTSSVRTLSAPGFSAPSSSSYYSNSYSPNHAQRNSLNSSVFKSDIGYKSQFGYNSGSQ